MACMPMQCDCNGVNDHCHMNSSYLASYISSDLLSTAHVAKFTHLTAAWLAK